QRRIQDVRLVYTPPKDLGKFGGDIDNWMYPRHTADFTFLRAYVGRDGRERPYHVDNVPLKTPTHLRVTTRGVKRGDLSLVIGFPGRTSRHVTTEAVSFLTETQVPMALQVLREMISRLNAWMRADADTRRKYASLEAGAQNAYKYYQMIDRGMKQFHVLETKSREQKRLLAAFPPRSAGVRNARRLLAEIAARYRGLRGYYRRLNSLIWISGWGSRSAAMAYDMVAWSIEKQKTNRMRKKQRYKDKNVHYFVRSARRFERETNLGTERALLVFFLSRNASAPKGQRLKALDVLLRWGQRRLAAVKKEARAKKIAFEAHFEALFGVAPAKTALERAVAMMLGETKLIAHGSDPASIKAAVDLRERVFKMRLPELRKLNDPLLSFAAALEGERRAIEEGPHRQITEHLATLLHPKWVAEVKRATYPDANSTVRLSYGKVLDYTSTATKREHRYITDLRGVLAKDKGRFPFNVPAFLKAAAPSANKSPFADKEIGDVPVNFTTTLDTTGGNSGSPVLDKNGDLVGLLFDGTPEAVISDWLYIAKDQRSICVDIRYALYLASLAKADALLREIGVEGR
ncbi:MAG: S46 family peptidase, partial [Myxococcales bacterium]|nr:S46 family peptidase [Myxococcales bacterium]